MALAAKRLGHCQEPAPEYLGCEKAACVQNGWVQKAEPGRGPLRYRGIGPAWPSGPWSLPLLAPKCGRWVSVRKLRHCPSTGPPPRTAASIQGERSPGSSAGPSPSGSRCTWGLVTSCPRRPHTWWEIVGTSPKLILQGVWDRPPLLCRLFHFGALIWGKRARVVLSVSAGLSHQHLGSSLHVRDTRAGAWKRGGGTWEDHVEDSTGLTWFGFKGTASDTGQQLPFSGPWRRPV